MSKSNVTKLQITYTVDKAVLKKFAELTESMCINRSQLIENYIKDWIKSQEK
jgi:metal-responsive CopG/Arc/MetJ family transcriptional regulator